jgi:predicted dehydrogenase
MNHSSTKAEALRVGLAGVGKFGQLHAAVLADLPGVELAAVADPDRELLDRIATWHGIESCYRDALALIDDDSLDAIILATPDEQHVSQAMAALERGKHLFVEKPLASNWEEGRHLQQLAVNRGALLQVGMILRYEASHRWLYSQIQAGLFGDLVSFRGQRNCSRRSFQGIADRVHTVHRTLIHDIDLLLWFSGSQVISVAAMDYRQGSHLSPNGCFAMLRLANGCVAQLESSWYVPDHSPVNVMNDHWSGCIDAELAVVGTQRSARINGLQSPLQVWTNQQLQSPDLSLWPSIDGRVFGALREQLADFLGCVASGQSSKVADVKSAVEALRIAQAVVEACRTNTVVSLNS